MPSKGGITVDKGAKQSFVFIYLSHTRKPALGGLSVDTVLPNLLLRSHQSQLFHTALLQASLLGLC